MCDFNKLANINVNSKVEKKNGLSYLSWAWAWSEFMKVYPNAKYEIKKFENNLPYIYDDKTGYMVFTSVTVDDVTHEMWLPVMDSNNKSMKNETYTYKVKEYEFKNGKNVFTGRYIDKTVETATMFDINKTIMRCLVKNLAMFGLGLYIYAGEDLPEETSETSIEATNNKLDEQIAKESEKLICSDCGKTIFKPAYEFSMSKYGKPLCRECLQKNKKLA